MISEPKNNVKRPARLADDVYDAIYWRLMLLEIPPEGRIPVDALARDLGVSQTPIREALSRLEMQKLVVKTHLIGYHAAPQMDRKQCEDLYAIRLLLEPFCARHAASAMDAEAIRSLDALNIAMRQLETGRQRSDYGKFAQLDAEFHDRIAVHGGNNLVKDTLRGLHAHVHLFRLFYHARATSEANKEHDAIVKAIGNRDPLGAEHAMAEHISRSRDRFMAFYG